MKRRPTDAEIRGIVSSMNIEGFDSTYESVKASLTDLYENFDPDEMTKIVAEINQPGANGVSIIHKYLDDLEAKISKKSRKSGRD